MSCDAGLRLLTPIDITAFTSTNVAEDDYPFWVAGSYSLGYRCIVSSEHAVYESLADSNTSNPTGGTNPDLWVYVGKTNAYKCIDDKVSTQTIKNDSLVMTFPVGKSISIAFLNVECKSLSVRVLDGTTEVYSETSNGVTRDTIGWYSYFTGEFKYKNFFLFNHLYNPTATYEITLTGDICKLGVMIKGTMTEIGATLWDASLGFYDFSKKDTDEWGETYLKEGAYSDYFRGEIAIETGKLQVVRKLLRARRGKLSLFVPSDRYDMTIYGFAREPELIWQNPKMSFCTFDISGVI